MNSNRLGRILSVAGICIAAVMAPGAAQAAFSCKSITWIVPFAPGGAVDLQTRRLADKLASALKVPIAVENRSGASGTAGAEYVAKAAPDGCTLLTVSSSQTVAQIENPDLGYKLTRDFTPVATLLTSPYFITVNSSVPAKNLQELIALAKKDPGSLNYATTGRTSLQALLGIRLASEAGIDIVPVAYKGSGEQLADFLSGRIQIVFAFPSVVQPYVDEGKLRYLAVSSTERISGYPDLPTVSEQLPGFELKTSYGILAPAKTPVDVVAFLNTEINKIVEEPTFKQATQKSAFVVVAGRPEAYGETIARELKDFGKLLELSK
jgi:tripartite-type tricarboxylate transporter receptor subunit TctC